MKSNFNQIAAAMSTMLARAARNSRARTPGRRRRADTSGLGSIYPATASGTGTFGVSGHFAGFRISVDFSAEIESKTASLNIGCRCRLLCPASKKPSPLEGHFRMPIAASGMVAGNLRQLKIKGERAPCQGTCSSSIPAAYCLPESEI